MGAILPQLSQGEVPFLLCAAVGPKVARFLRNPMAEDLAMEKDGLEMEKLFSPPALYATFAIFFDYPDDPFHPRLIARLTRTDKKSVARELRKLKEIGILRGGPGGRGNAYWLNPDFPLYSELGAIFAKTRKSRRYRQPLSPFLELLS